MDWLNSHRDRAPTGDASIPSTRKSSALPPTSDTAALQPESTPSLPSKPFPLCRLPAELRDAIYTHLFTSATPLIKPTYTIPPFLLTNHQIHTEAIGLYYSLSTFRCLDEDSAVKWLVNLRPEIRELLQEVKYDTRWIIFKTPFIPVLGAEIWLWDSLRTKLREQGLVVGRGTGVEECKFVRAVGRGVIKLSFWRRTADGSGGEVGWLDVEDLEDEVDRANDD